MGNYADFVDLTYTPEETDLIASFRVTVPRWENPKRAYGAVAAESSVGTWTPVEGSRYPHVKRIAARVFSIERGGWIKIAYPIENFEPGSIPQLFSSIAGNIYAMRAVSQLRLQDVHFPREYIRHFKGPRLGIRGVKRIFRVKRPLLITVPKPKVGMTWREHATVGYAAWTGGVDLLKDDENLTNQSFNRFAQRIKAAFKLRDRAEKETGEKKSYLVNITAPSARELEKRARMVAEHGGEYVMLDIITSGWLATQTLREIAQDYTLAIHAHRAMHASFSRPKKHGMSMIMVAKAARLAGVDQLHIGTAGLGKMEGGQRLVLKLEEEVTEGKVQEVLHEPVHEHIQGKAVAEDPKLHTLPQEWYHIKPILPVASGGLHPLLLYGIFKTMGADIAVQLGGGIHGHPKGTHAGAIAARSVIDAYMKGEDLQDVIHRVPEVRQAYEYWGLKRVR